MTDIRAQLRDADPVLSEPGLRGEEVAAMRRRVLDATQEPRGAVVEWRRTLAFAMAVAVVAGAGVDMARRVRPQSLPSPVESIPASANGTTRTQLQFATPGGTRIIWTIDPAFHLTEKR